MQQHCYCNCIMQSACLTDCRAANVFPCAHLVNMFRPPSKQIPETHQKALFFSGALNEHCSCNGDASGEHSSSPWLPCHRALIAISRTTHTVQARGMLAPTGQQHSVLLMARCLCPTTSLVGRVCLRTLSALYPSAYGGPRPFLLPFPLLSPPQPSVVPWPLLWPCSVCTTCPTRCTGGPSSQAPPLLSCSL